jgi:hypothetical protein
MTPHWLNIQDWQRRLNFWIDDIIERIWENRWTIMYRNLIGTNRLELQGMQCLGSFDLCLYRRNRVKIFQSILWLSYQSERGLVQYG